MPTHTPMPPQTRNRTYGQYCPVAAGLDVIGDRWVLLIMRELVAQPSRFTDLRRALPGLAPNLLTERLRDLQAAALVESVDVSESSSRSIYQVTDKGLKIIPVLRAVARFGVDYLDPATTPNLPAEGLSPARTARAFLLPWLKPGAPHMRVRLTVPDGSSADVVVDGRRTDITDADPGVAPDVELRTDALALSDVRRTGAPLEATLAGSPTAKDKFLKTFDLVIQ
ncbi:HxlR family transcriptional regulator [Antricoccus suffuscus]|uniref:HxlR family transcriptional regulator n=1 Tax=Antricoccus suffuscus TaxID=1629062 RepID=A0A2T1A7W0_9ACTN|nr:helix-turn-helix domain-containing protein [Antricoccus suffuscus]PRZ44428.1 HxlR family transcriptional regulator [Antricoccus suffuscus]